MSIKHIPLRWSTSALRGCDSTHKHVGEISLHTYPEADAWHKLPHEYMITQSPEILVIEDEDDADEQVQWIDLLPHFEALTCISIQEDSDHCRDRDQASMCFSFS